MSARAITRSPLPTRILLAEAVNLVKDALCGGTDRERESLASNKIYSALCEGDLESRAGYVTCKSQKAWVLTNWNIPPELWRVVTLFLYNKNKAKVWAFPANVPRPQGWPNLGAITDQALRDDAPVCMTEIKVVSDGILRRLGLWRSYEPAAHADSNDPRRKTEQPTPLPKPEIEKWFNDRIKPGQAKTSEREDTAAFKAQFGGHKYNRTWFREVRRKVVPAEWLKTGPSRPRELRQKIEPLVAPK